MNQFQKLILVFFSLLTINVQAQDIHFTQYNMSPMTLNPALTGAFEGSFRIGGIYRDQWRSVIGKAAYRTPSIYVDAPVFKGIGKKDWVGAGFILLNDQSGSANLNNLTAMLSLSYHLALGRKANTYLSFGAQGGIIQKKVDFNALQFENQFDQNGQFDPNRPSGENFLVSNISYTDFQAGVLLKSYLSKYIDFDLGFTTKHLTQPYDAFLGNEKLQRVHAATAGINIDITKKTTFSPSVLYQFKAPTSEMTSQAMFAYTLNQEKQVRLLGGAGFRYAMVNADMLAAIVGIEFGGFKVGAAYDFNVSSLSAQSKSQGGFEVALSYIAKIYKTPIVKPVLFCPRF